eukprot:c15997_g2_i1.p1 GENE.c15997_g2_i1~~c15997_g2_i1.p1  ORF type:complete len:312 (+),score=80.60 c15997_g2_i1:72-1007(+)
MTTNTNKFTPLEVELHNDNSDNIDTNNSLKERVFWVSSEKIIGHRNDAPYFMYDGTHENVKTGFRLNYNLSDAICSFFMLHNETLNVWTHVIPIPYIIWKSYQTIQTELKDANQTDIGCFILFTTATVFAFFSSATYHLFRCISSETNNLLLRFDIAGILMMIAACYIPALSFAFGCNDYNYFLIYSICIYSLGILSAGIILTQKSFEKNFTLIAPPVTMVLVSIVPILHFVLTHQGDPVIYDFFLVLSLSLACYGVGLGFYIYYFPERYLQPGYCDLFLHSHVLWHIFVVFGALAHYRVLSVLYQWKLTN